jgi:hypothetical protein
VCEHALDEMFHGASNLRNRLQHELAQEKEVSFLKNLPFCKSSLVVKYLTQVVPVCLKAGIGVITWSLLLPITSDEMYHWASILRHRLAQEKEVSSLNTVVCFLIFVYRSLLVHDLLVS